MLGAIVLVVFGFLLPFFDIVQATNCASTLSEVKASIRSAVPGDEICIANGVYHDMVITVVKEKLTIRGEEGGKVILKGDSSIKLKGYGIVVKNFVFTAPLSEGNKRSISTPIEFMYKAENCLVYDCMIHDHAADTWVKMRGKGNTLSHCTFKDKTAPELSSTGKELRISNIVSASDSKMSDIHIHHNRFINYDPDALVSEHKHGSAEAVYVKISKDAGRDTKMLNCVVDHNYFYKVDSEEETIGIKSSGNHVFENAIEECYGGISLRHGRNNYVGRNFIQGRMTESKQDYGINVHDENHLIMNNWIMDVGQHHGIRIVGGDGPVDCNSCHVRAKNVKVLNNTLINSVLNFGRKFAGGKYSAPTKIEIKDLTVSCSKNYAMIDGYRLDETNAFSAQRYLFRGTNRFYGRKLAYTKVLNNLSNLIAQKKIEWDRKAKDLGDYGKRMIKKIKCASGTSWEQKLSECMKM